MRRTVIAASSAGAAALAAFVLWWASPTTAQDPAPVPPAQGNNGNGQAKPPSVPLPIGHVVLFSSGVGYFQREGEVEGNSRVDLTFPGTDVNDLLKSLVLQDLGRRQGQHHQLRQPRPDRQDAQELRARPDHQPDASARLLNQARGEKVEVTLQQGNAAQPGTVTGVIVGMESQHAAGTARTRWSTSSMLNLLCTEGIRSVPLSAGPAAALRSTRPWTSEFRRALEVLATRHDTQKKVVSLGFNGEGKRR